MRIQYVLPGVMSRTEAGKKEMQRRLGLLQKWAADGTTVGIVDIENGPMSIESHYEEYLSAPGAMERVREAEQAGFDAAIVGCYGDPGVDGARELVRIPVVGPGEASMFMACMLGHKYGIVSVMESTVPTLDKLARLVGADAKYIGAMSVGIPVLELASDCERTFAAIVEAGRSLVGRGADTLVLGCMSMAFIDISGEVEKALSIPVINPARAALAMAETLVRCGLSHSKKAYPLPPKLAAAGRWRPSDDGTQHAQQVR